MGNYSSALLAVAQQPSPQLYVLVKITMPNGSVKRYASGPINVTEVGNYHGRIVSMGSIYRSAGDITGALIYPKLDDIVIEDMDGSFGRELELQKPDGALVEMHLAGNAVAVADWMPLFGNGILDDWRMDSPGQWILTSSYNDLALRSPFPKTQILRSDFPFAADPVMYTYSALVAYGEHDSRNAGDKGMVSCYYVDTSAGLFGPWLGWITVQRVYLNGVLVPTGWSVVHPIINGRQYTLIQMPVPYPTANQIVTADITGYTSGTDGAGTLLTGADAMSHLLSHWVFPIDEWTSGAWNGAHSLLSVTHFDEMQDFLELLSWQKVSRQYGGDSRISAAAAIQEFCRSLGAIGGCAPIFTGSGKFGIRPNNFVSTVLSYSGLRRLRYNQNELGDRGTGSFTMWRNRQYLADRLNIKSILATAANEFKTALEVRDLSVDRNRASELELPWSHAKVE